MIEPQFVVLVLVASLQIGAVIYGLIMLTRIARNVEGQSESLRRIADSLARETRE